MPAIGNIAINDGKTTPVLHTFAPVTTDGSAAELANRSASIPQGFEVVKVELRKPTSNTAAYRLYIEMVLPTVGLVNGADAVVRFNKASMTVNISQLSSEADRKDLRVLLQNLLGHASMATVFEKLEPIY
jgi:hypothetical protein